MDKAIESHEPLSVLEQIVVSDDDHFAAFTDDSDVGGCDGGGHDADDEHGDDHDDAFT